MYFSMENNTEIKISKCVYLKEWRNKNKDRYKMHKQKENNLRRDYKIYRFIKLLIKKYLVFH